MGGIRFVQCRIGNVAVIAELDHITRIHGDNTVLPIKVGVQLNSVQNAVLTGPDEGIGLFIDQGRTVISVPMALGKGIGILKTQFINLLPGEQVDDHSPGLGFRLVIFVSRAYIQQRVPPGIHGTGALKGHFHDQLISGLLAGFQIKEVNIPVFGGIDDLYQILFGLGPIVEVHHLAHIAFPLYDEGLPRPAAAGPVALGKAPAFFDLIDLDFLIHGHLVLGKIDRSIARKIPVIIPPEAQHTGNPGIGIPAAEADLFRALIGAHFRAVYLDMPHIAVFLRIALRYTIRGGFRRRAGSRHRGRRRLRCGGGRSGAEQLLDPAALFRLLRLPALNLLLIAAAAHKQRGDQQKKQPQSHYKNGQNGIKPGLENQLSAPGLFLFLLYLRHRFLRMDLRRYI